MGAYIICVYCAYGAFVMSMQDKLQLIFINRKFKMSK